MNFETLKKNNKKKYILVSIVIIGVLATVTFIGTRAKYRVTNSVQLASGVINYSPSDLEMIAIKIQNDSNEYDDTDTIPTSGYTLNTEKSVCKVGEEKQEVSITYENGKVGISGITTKGTKCQIYFDIEKCGTSCKLILSKNTIDTSRSNGYFPAAYEEDTAGRIFSAEDDDGTTYFFAGSNPNNWVTFCQNISGGNIYWRIIRINGDGSIRLIYNGSKASQTGTSTQIGKSVFNTSSNDNVYVGYMYGASGSSTYAETHANTNSSTIKTYLDNWYETNLKNVGFEQYIDKTSGFCGDRTVDNYSGEYTSGYTGDGSGTTKTEYAPNKRVFSTYTATYKCSNNNDYYTVSSSTKGNKALENPIGLITIDEVMYAGGYKSGTQNHWLKTGQTYWTMSPYDFDGNTASEHNVSSNGYFSSDFVAISYGARPVISLKADTLKYGSGTTSDPFRMTVNTGTN